MSKTRRLKKKPFTGAEITLQSPAVNQFESFIVGNAVQCMELCLPELRAKAPADLAALDGLDLPLQDRLNRTLGLALRYCEELHVVRTDSAKGKSVVICGAGPSLTEHAAAYCADADEVWGCNSALTYLVANGHRVTHGFAVDQTPEMLEEWASAPDVEYLIASTVHVHLTEYLRSKGRRVRFFHNYVGIAKPHVEWPDEDGVVKKAEYEDWLYALLFPGTIRAGSGLNAVTRAIDVALMMGFDQITVLGADCALRVTSPRPDCALGSPEHVAWLQESVVMHADGGHAMASGATMMTLDGVIDGRTWTSKPDMLISAVFLVEMARKFRGRLHLIGDTLPNALKDKPKAFLDRLPSLVDSNGKRLKLA